MELLTYEGETGEFRWNCQRGRARKGDVAGVVSRSKKQARIIIGVDGSYYLAHRLAWLYSHGVWPSDQIDHANGNGLDNRLVNLRSASGEQNARNQRAKPSRSGLKGAAWDESRQQYVATIRIGNGARRTIGRFDTAEAAHQAYVAAAKEHHKEFARHA